MTVSRGCDCGRRGVVFVGGGGGGFGVCKGGGERGDQSRLGLRHPKVPPFSLFSTLVSSFHRLQAKAQPFDSCILVLLRPHFRTHVLDSRIQKLLMFFN